RAYRGGTARDRRPARDPRRQERLPPLRAVRPAAYDGRMDGRVGSGLEPPLEPPSARGLDFGRRGGAADLPRTRALGRGLAWRDRPCASFHRAAHAPRLRLSRAALCVELDRPGAPADGAARSAEGERERRVVPTAGPSCAPSAAAL